jgi:hypothetical protein
MSGFTDEYCAAIKPEWALALRRAARFGRRSGAREAGVYLLRIALFICW